jgi:hypothetical protein
MIDAYFWWVPMMAQTDALPPAAVGGIIAAVIGGLIASGYLGKKVGETKAEHRDVTVKQPVPTVTIREEESFLRREDFDDHMLRTDKQIGEIWEAIQAERNVARTALGRIHERLDAQTRVTATLQGSVEEVGKNVGRLLDLALQPPNRKPPAR